MLKLKLFSKKHSEDEPVAQNVRGTSINLLFAGVIGAGITIIFYLFIQLPGISGSYFYDIFCKRGIIQYATTFFFFWGIGILILKHIRIQSEKSSFDQDLLVLDPGTLIRQEDALQHIRKLKRLSSKERGKMLPNRVWHALVRFKLLGSAEKVDDMLKYQGEMDDASMESSYSFLKFVIALVPILGFLGTVLGISAAVAGFSAVISAAETSAEASGGGVAAIQDALKNVTVGLATAFDTTLLALVMSAFLMLGLTIFQRKEEVLLNKIDEYCIENLLDRLWVPPVSEQFEQAMVRALSNLPRNIAREINQNKTT